MFHSEPCPFVKSPSDDCYVSTMNSTSIADAVYYCGGNYRECPIYKRHIGTTPERIAKETTNDHPIQERSGHMKGIRDP